MFPRREAAPTWSRAASLAPRGEFPKADRVSAGQKEGHSPSLVRARAWVTGRVQGVGFRAFAQAQASRRNLGGMARNLADGRVEVEVEGQPSAVQAFLAELQKGPSLAKVDDLQVSWETPTGEGSSFHIGY